MYVGINHIHGVEPYVKLLRAAAAEREVKEAHPKRENEILSCLLEKVLTTFLVSILAFYMGWFMFFY